jgi:hypothetical protein
MSDRAVFAICGTVVLVAFLWLAGSHDDGKWRAMETCIKEQGRWSNWWGGYCIPKSGGKP